MSRSDIAGAVLVLLALISSPLVIAFSNRRFDEVRHESEAWRMRTELCEHTADNCDHALLTCLSWQVRVKHELETINITLTEACQ